MLLRSLLMGLTALLLAMACAAQALDFRRPLRAGDGVERAHACVRRAVTRYDEDRELHVDIAAVRGLMDEGALADAVRPVLEA